MAGRIAGEVIAVRITGVDGPDRSCPGPDGIALGIQRKQDVLDPVPSSSDAIVFDAEIEVVPADGGADFRGPYVHGPKGDRFLYLAWVTVREGEMVARIKLKLADIDPDLIAQAIRDGGTLAVQVRLLNAQGKPASGSVRPPAVTWSLAAAISPSHGPPDGALTA